MSGMLTGGATEPRAGTALDLNANPEAAGTMPPSATGSPNASNQRIAQWLNGANTVASTIGQLSAASKGPVGSPLAAQQVGTGGTLPYTPTAKMRLSQVRRG